MNKQFKKIDKKSFYGVVDELKRIQKIFHNEFDVDDIWTYSKVFEIIKPLSPGSFSEIVKDSDSFFFVYLLQKKGSSTPTLRENWEQLEWFALQNKFNIFFIDWYKENSDKVYIKKYSKMLCFN